MSRVFTKATTGIASWDKYHPALKAHLETLKEMAKYAEDNGGINPEDFAEDSSWQAFLDDCVVCHAPGVYSVAYLHPEYCKDIIHEVSKFVHEPNLEEPLEAQIPEVTLQSDHPVFYEVFHSFWADAGVPLAKVLFNLEPDVLTSVQSAVYEPSETDRGHWHTDRDSDVTLVVALNDDHEGGGTMVAQGPFFPDVKVPQNLPGWAMFFKGKTTLHYGLPVTSGERHLLVHWSEVK
jgi:hypothetical protein